MWISSQIRTVSKFPWFSRNYTLKDRKAFLIRGKWFQILILKWRYVRTPKYLGDITEDRMERSLRINKNIISNKRVFIYWKVFFLQFCETDVSHLLLQGSKESNIRSSVINLRVRLQRKTFFYFLFFHRFILESYWLFLWRGGRGMGPLGLSLVENNILNKN